MSCNVHIAYFTKLTLNRTWTFRNSGPFNFKKRILYQYSLYWLKNIFLTNSRMLISNMTIDFQSYIPKKKEDPVGPKFKDFYFCTKLCTWTISRMLISNMVVFFSVSKFQSQKMHLWSQNLRIFTFIRNFVF